jgi:hypothetical protein
MKEDKLKKYIDDHRDDFDQDIPPSGVWTAIEKQIQSKRKKRGIIQFLPAVLKVAASVLVLLSAGAGIGVYMVKKKDFTYAIHDPANRKEYREASSYFASQIDNKLNELQQYKPGESVLKDLNNIDQVSAELKLEIVKNPDQDQDMLVQEMIKQYQQKLSVLNKILDKLHESNQKSSTTNQIKSNNDTLHL